eukprot:gene24580-30946_t
MVRRMADFGPATVFHIMGLVDPGFVRSSMDYLNLQYDVVPSQFIEQYRMTARKRLATQSRDIALPYEITSQMLEQIRLAPPPLTEDNLVTTERTSSMFNQQLATQKEEQKEVDEDELVVASILTKVKIKDKKLLKAQQNKSSADGEDDVSSNGDY